MPLSVSEVKDLITFCKKSRVSKLSVEGVEINLSPLAFVDPESKKKSRKENNQAETESDLLYAST